MSSLLTSALVVGLCAGCALAPSVTPESPSPLGAEAAVRAPTPGTSWQYLLTGRTDAEVPADLVVLDGSDSDAARVEDLHAGGHYVVCYVNAGAWEDWRPDAEDYPSAVLGQEMDGWAGERWLDVRAWESLRPLLAARVADCAAKGFDAVDFDNVDGWSQDTGFSATRADQLTFNRALAQLAHDEGLAVGLKNDLEQIPDLVEDFDFAINESCEEWKECGSYAPFVAAGKAVLHVEYPEDLDADACPEPRPGFSTILKSLNLGTAVVQCPAAPAPSVSPSAGPEALPDPVVPVPSAPAKPSASPTSPVPAKPSASSTPSAAPTPSEDVSPSPDDAADPEPAPTPRRHFSARDLFWWWPF